MKKQIKRKNVVVRDETLRDGAQQPGINLTFDDRKALAMMSAELLNVPGSPVCNQIDLGMPEISAKMRVFIRNLSVLLKKFERIDLFVTGRSTEQSLEDMMYSLEPVPEERRIIAPFIGVSTKHRRKMSMNKRDVLRNVKKTMGAAMKYNARIHFPLEGGYNAYLEDREYVYDIFSVLEDIGVEAVPLCDTVGISLPFELSTSYPSYGEAIADLSNRFPGIQISSHCHNDFGLALANTLQGILNGAAIVDGTYFGIGERAGNTSLQELLTVLNEKQIELGVSSNSNLRKLTTISKKMAAIIGIKVPGNTPIIGRNVFRHASGIHQSGTLKDSKTYEPYKPKDIGLKGHKISLSYLSGKSGINYILQEKFNIRLNEQQLTSVSKKFKEMVDKGRDPERDLIRVVGKVLQKTD